MNQYPVARKHIADGAGCESNPSWSEAIIDYWRMIQAHYPCSVSGVIVEICFFQGCMAILLVLTGTHQELYSYTMFANWAFLALTRWRSFGCAPLSPRCLARIESGIPLDAADLRRCGFCD